MTSPDTPEQRQVILLELSDRLRAAPDPVAPLDMAAALLARHTGLALVHFLAVGADGDSYDVIGGYSDGRLPDLLNASGRISDHGSEWGPQFRRGAAVFSDNHDSRPGNDAARQRALGIRAGSAVPLIRAGRLVAILSTGHPEPHRWTEAEKSLQCEIAERSWDAATRARAEAALIEREARLDAILETARDYAILSTDPEGRVETWSHGAERVFGWTEDEIRGRMMDAAFTPEDRAAGIPEWERRTAREAGFAPGVRWHLRKDGARVFIEGVVRPRIGPDGGLSGYVKVGQDVTERRAMQERLRASEALLRQFAAATRDVIWIRDAESLQFTYVSPASEPVYGIAPEALAGKNDLQSWAALVHPDDRMAALGHLHRVREGRHVTHEFRIRRASDGRERWIRNTDFPIRDAAGRVASIAGIGTDITELKRAQMTLAANERRFRTLAEGIPQLVWRARGPDSILWLSPQSRAYVGLPEPALPTRNRRSPVHPDDRPAVRAAWEHAGATGIYEVAMRLREAATGRYRWFQARAAPVRNGAGEVIEWLGTSTDIQDMMEAQERQAALLAELQHRTRNLMAVVGAMMEATLRDHPDPDRFAPVFRDRIHALARVSGLLSRVEDDRRISFETLLRTELEAEGLADADGHDARLTLDGPTGMPLKSSTVQILALALHELVSDALESGALSVPDGRLSIRWHRTGGSRPRLRVEWREAGAAPARVPRDDGYGRSIIEGALPYQLEAETLYARTAQGLHCTITLPLSSTAKA